MSARFQPATSIQTRSTHLLRPASPGPACVLCVLCLLAAGRGLSTSQAVAADAKTKNLEAGAIKLTVPESWESKTASNNFRLAQCVVPKAEGDTEDGEFVVFHFGSDGGGVDANLKRWIRQFQTKDRKVAITSGKSPQGDYVLVDLRGTYLKPVGPPVQGRTIELPKARVVAVILKVKDQGNYFLRLTGPEKTTSANVNAFRAAIGADAKAEMEYKLADE